MKALEYNIRLPRILIIKGYLSISYILSQSLIKNNFIIELVEKRVTPTYEIYRYIFMIHWLSGDV